MASHSRLPVDHSLMVGHVAVRRLKLVMARHAARHQLTVWIEIRHFEASVIQ